MEESAFVIEEFRMGNQQNPQRTAVIVNDKSNGLQILRYNKRLFAPWTKLVSAFLPEGYPNSVTSDYLAFQTWDTMQGISTYIRSMLSTQALLSAIGVGEATATAVGATFQWFLRDFTGMLGGIIFTLYQGSNLDNRAKQWRLAADFINDIGMLLDLISPLFPGSFLVLLCVGSAARAITGVASGATRAALTHHFAKQRNAADVSAKEGSQETAATLIGMVLGMLLARFTARNPLAIWISFLILTVFHMYANYRAVRSLCLRSLNAERLQILLQSFTVNKKVLSPKEASKKESFIPQFFCSRKIILGSKISSLNVTKSMDRFTSLSNKYKAAELLYFIVADEESVQVILHKDATSTNYLRAYTHSLILLNNLKKRIDDPEQSSIEWMELNYAVLLSEMERSGWDVGHVLISTTEWRADWNNCFRKDK